VHVRRCPECGSDYRPEIVTCADCGVLLEDRDDELDDPGVGPQTGTGALDDPAAVPEGFEPLLSAHTVRDLQPLADRLIESGIQCRLRESRSSGHVIGYRLFVPADDGARAVDCVAQDLSDDCGISLVHGIQSPLDPDDGYHNCPACGAELQRGALACPECELPLATPEDTCPGCGEVCERGPESRCRHCGHVFDPGE